MTPRRPPEKRGGGSGRNDEILTDDTDRRQGNHQEKEEGGGSGLGMGGGSERGDGNRSPCPMRPGAVDTVALDIRPLHDYESSGAGHLGKVGVLCVVCCVLDVGCGPSGVEGEYLSPGGGLPDWRALLRAGERGR